MKISKSLTLIVAIIGLLICSVALILLSILVYRNFFSTSYEQPSPPVAILKISGQDWELPSEFKQYNNDCWEKKQDSLFFNNRSRHKQSVSLYTAELASEHKKRGFVTTKVKTFGQFDLLEDDAMFGFQLGEKDAPDSEKLFLGVNGKGEVLVLDGNFKKLRNEQITKGKPLNGNCCETTELYFYYAKHANYWQLFFGANNKEVESYAAVNYIPYKKLDDPNKELSLVVYNPSREGEIWFKDWYILNDWTPNGAFHWDYSWR